MLCTALPSVSRVVRWNDGYGIQNAERNSLTALPINCLISCASMPNKESDSAIATLCGADLEKWRTENGLTKSEASDAFGLRIGAWEELVGRDGAQEKIDDPTVAMLLYIYREYPETAPIAAPLNVPEFYEFLGLGDSPADRETFAILIGRSKPSAYRLLTDKGTPGRPVARWIEAVRKLRLAPKTARLLMTDVVNSVGAIQGNADVWAQGWHRRGK